jgi:TatD DNase family protein
MPIQMLIDTHCHLDFPEFNADRSEVIKRAKDEGIGYIVNIGSSLKGSKDSLDLARQYDFIYATVGLHPHEADSFSQAVESELAVLARNNKVAAIGEIGLDYYKNYSKPENQRIVFESLLKLAKSSGLPVVIHNRDAQADTLEILKKFLPINAVVHCFSGDANFLKECLDLGFFISFTCNITYRKAENLRGFLKLTPLEKLLLETDAPFLPPEGLRGKRNEPAFVKELAKKISEIKNLSLEEVAKATSENAIKFFKLK